MVRTVGTDASVVDSVLVPHGLPHVMDAAGGTSSAADDPPSAQADQQHSGDVAMVTTAVEDLVPPAPPLLQDGIDTVLGIVFGRFREDFVANMGQLLRDSFNSPSMVSAGVHATLHASLRGHVDAILESLPWAEIDKSECRARLESRIAVVVDSMVRQVFEESFRAGS